MDFQTNTNRGRLHMTAPYKDIISQIFEQFKNTKPTQVIICGGGAKSPKIQVSRYFLNFQKSKFWSKIEILVKSRNLGKKSKF